MLSLYHELDILLGTGDAAVNKSSTYLRPSLVSTQRLLVPSVGIGPSIKLVRTYFKNLNLFLIVSLLPKDLCLDSPISPPFLYCSFVNHGRHYLCEATAITVLCASLVFSSTLWNQCYYFHLMDEEMKAQTSQVSRPRSHSVSVEGVRNLNHGLSNSKIILILYYDSLLHHSLGWLNGTSKDKSVQETMFRPMFCPCVIKKGNGALFHNCGN